MEEQELKRLLANPYHAVITDNSHSDEHELEISEEDWIRANTKLIEEIGAAEWLNHLLEALKSKQV